MSFTESIQKVVYTYIDTVSKKYSLNVEELRSLWDGKPSQTSSFLQPSIFSTIPPPKIVPVSQSTEQSVNQSSVDMEDLSPARLNGCTKTELAALCKSRGLKVGGNKPDLVNRLLEFSGQPSTTTPSSTGIQTSITQHLTKQPEKKVPKTNRVEAASSIIQKLKAEIKAIPIRSNKFGNLEHPETGLVVDRKTQQVYGKQLDDGTVADLTPSDIQNAKMLGLSYVIPKNLDDKLDLDSVKVEDVDINFEETKNNEDEEELAEEEDEEELPEEEDEEELAEED